METVWTAERSRFRNRTAVAREDRVLNPPDELDVRDLLAHFYVGPSLRVEGEGDTLPPPRGHRGGGPARLPLPACHRWSEGARERCAECEGPVDVVIAARPPRR